MDDDDPTARLRAAETLGELRASASPPIADPAWSALPLRPDVPPSPEVRAARVRRLLAWAEAEGASWDGIEFHVDAAGHASVRARRAIAPGEVILTLPRHLMIFERELGLAPRDALAVWLALEVRDPTSRWRPYLDVLPVALPELPMFHDRGALAALAGTSAYALVADGHRELRDAHDRLRARVSLADFAWGRAIVMSRAYHAPGALDHRLALLPLVDLLDHRLGDTTWSYDPRDGKFAVATERGFAPGDPVHFPYGDRGNTSLFVHFGFAVPGNPADEAGLRFERAVDPVNAAAAHLLWGLPLDGPIRLPIANVLDHRFVRALSVARLFASGPVERARAVEVGLWDDGDLPWLGGELEEAALALMAAAARRAVDEIDARPLANPLYAIVRDSERAVLAQLIEIATTARALVATRDPARLRAVDARGLLRDYLQAVADALVTDSASARAAP